MQVDPTLTNAGNGGAVSPEGGALNQAPESMVGNPPQTLPAELRGDLPLSQQSKPGPAGDSKGLDAPPKGSTLSRCVGAPALQPRSSSSSSNLPVSPASENAVPHDTAEAPGVNTDGSAVFPTQLRPCKRAGPEAPPPSPSLSQANPNKVAGTTAQPFISLPPGFHCSSFFKAGQPVAFLPATSFSSPLCKITLPPGLGQIAALREVTANQFRTEGQSQTSSPSVTPQLRAYPYHFSVGRALAPDTKPTSAAAAKPKCGSASSSKNSKAGAEHDPPLGCVASPAVVVPLKQPTLTSAPPTLSVSPSAPIRCSSALASIATHSRLLNNLEKGSARQGAEKPSLPFHRLESSSGTKETTAVCPTDVRDVPLDLSAKSKRQKTDKDPQKPQQATEQLPMEAGPNDSLPLKKDTMVNFGPSSPYAILSDTLRNGAPPTQPPRLSNHQVLEQPTTWAKASPQAPVGNLLGTYVGVASPILASTLRSKDGKGAAFVDDVQSVAKQESISIIDQGEQLAHRGKKGHPVTKESQQSKCSNSNCSPGTQDNFPTAFCAPADSHPPGKPGSGKASVPHSPAAEGSARHHPALHPHQRVSKQQKVFQGGPKIKLDPGCPIQVTPHSSPPITDDEKWDKAKSPLSNLESIVKQKALETSALTSQGSCNLATFGPRRPEVASFQAGHQDTLFQPLSARGFPPFSSERWREGKLPPRVACRQEKGSVAEVREKTSERLTGQGGVTEGGGLSDASGLVGYAVAGGGKQARGMDRGGSREAKPIAESLSPCVKLEGIALSILKGQCTVVSELESKTTGTKAKAAGSKHKKLGPSKPDGALSEPSKKVATGVKKLPEKQNATVQPKTLNKRWAPALEQSLPEVAPSQRVGEPNKTRRGRSGPSNGDQPPHKKAGITSASLTPCQSHDVPASQHSPAGAKQRPDSTESNAPQLRRGRRRAEQARRNDWGFSAPSPPPPPPPPPSPPPLPLPPPVVPPPPAFRRPRGRPRSNPLPSQVDPAAARPAHSSEGDASSRKKRRRRRNRKYQNGEYITEREQAAEGEAEGEETCVTTRLAARVGTGVYPRLSATVTVRSISPEPSPRRALLTRSGSVRRPECHTLPEPIDKPSGKRKFKSKHLCDTEEEKKPKTKRSSSVKRPAGPLADADGPPAKKPTGLFTPPKGLPSPPASRKSSARRGGTPESPPGRPVPPEVRRLIVNKNAGETLLQRAARLGYQEVVLYCLEKDVREVNRRDNAGYTALHEACARGWAHIVQMLLEHGADVNSSAQDGTRPIHDAVVSDNLPVVWMLLSHGADPSLATYSGQTAVKLAQSHSMKTFLTEYFADLELRADQDRSLHWDFYSSAVFETGMEACWEFLLSLPEDEEERGTEKDSFMFEFSSEPLLPCYHVQVSLYQGFCNWFLLSDVLKRLKMSARIFRARYPHFEVVSIPHAEFCRQVSVSQVTPVPPEFQKWGEDDEGDGPVELVRCVPDLQGLLGSSVHILEEELLDAARPCGR